jgi:hypothetical protein
MSPVPARPRCRKERPLGLLLAGDLLVVDAAPEHASLDCSGPSIEPVCAAGVVRNIISKYEQDRGPDKGGS